MNALPSQLMMARETRVSPGKAPHSLRDGPLPERTWQLVGDSFLMRGDGGHYLHYRRGGGITVERGSGTDAAWEPLWLAGTVHAAIACLNGLVPIHASAVAHDGQVYAFTGPSGAGKSTLVAALGRFGLPMVCDDTLVLDPAQEGRIMCLPGHKRLKLTPEAAVLTGAATHEGVGPKDGGLGKVYASAPSGDVGEALPLACLAVIEYGERFAITPLTGSAKLRALLTDHYTVDLLGAAQASLDTSSGPQTLFAQLSVLAARMSMVRLRRAHDVSRLREGAASVANWIQGHQQ